MVLDIPTPLSSLEQRLQTLNLGGEVEGASFSELQVIEEGPKGGSRSSSGNSQLCSKNNLLVGCCCPTLLESNLFIRPLDGSLRLVTNLYIIRLVNDIEPLDTHIQGRSHSRWARMFTIEIFTYTIGDYKWGFNLPYLQL